MKKANLAILAMMAEIHAQKEAESEGKMHFEIRDYTKRYESNKRGQLVRTYDHEITSKLPEPPIPNGMKKFTIDGKDIYALNYKNALKKYNRKP